MVEGDHGDTRHLEVKIPPGVDNGSRVRIAGEGTRQLRRPARRPLPRRSACGPHDKYERKGDDLYVDVEAPLTTPVLGGEVEVQGIGKKVALRLPPGTQNGQTFRLAGLGMPKLGSPGQARRPLRPRQGAPAQGSQRIERQLFEQLKEAGV